MAQPRRISIDHLTALELSPVDVAELAGRLGCSDISIIPGIPGLPELGVPDIVADHALHRRIAQACRAAGVRVHSLEGFMLNADTPPDRFDMLFAMAAAVGARYGVVIVGDPERQRAADGLAALCDRAQAQGMRLNIEYVPTTCAPSLERALALIEAAGAPDNAGLVVDILHHIRSGATMESLQAIDPRRIGVAQICDGLLGAEWNHYLETEMLFERLLPGEGDFPLEAFLTSLPDDVLVGIEIPMASRRRRGEPVEACVARAVQSLSALLAGLPMSGLIPGDDAGSAKRD